MPILDLFWTMLWFFLFFAWLMLLFKVFTDIFRSESSGWTKAIWCFFVILLPLLGTLFYLIFNGGEMAQRDVESMAAAEKAQRDYIQNVAGGSASTADELAKLGDLKAKGVLSEEEFAAQKAKILA
ncbi:MAG TPA: SHOCT domain-containing protein [Acidimicrobiia bacterium]